MSDRVARRRAETRRRIFEAAMLLFIERGYDNVTVADITEAADVAKGTFFTHFPSKHDIFRYVGAEAVDAMTAAISDTGTARQRITKMLLAAANWHENNRELSRQMFLVRSFTFATDLGSESQRRFAQQVTTLLKAGIDAGEFRTDLDIAAATSLVQGSYYLSVILWHSTPDGPSLSDRIHAALRILFEGMS